MSDGTTTTDLVIYHNPACATSRNTLALIRHAGIEPHIIEYLKSPPTSAMLLNLIARMAVPLRAILREKDTPFAELGLGRSDVSDADILRAIAEHPILINRPIVAGPWGVKLCRPSEAVLDILPIAPWRPFTKEDGEVVIDQHGNRLI
jgi:arsenate reductase (glutaredoxin)